MNNSKQPFCGVHVAGRRGRRRRGLRESAPRVGRRVERAPEPPRATPRDPPRPRGSAVPQTPPRPDPGPRRRRAGRLPNGRRTSRTPCSASTASGATGPRFFRRKRTRRRAARHFGRDGRTRTAPTRSLCIDACRRTSLRFCGDRTAAVAAQCRWRLKTGQRR